MAKIVFIGLVLFGLWLFLRRSAPVPPIDEKEARAILGVDKAADADAIRAAHRRLVTAVHPDRGGSVELARRINAARDVLLKRRN
jgi:DnaJ-domain-containing protein 1